MPQQLFRFLNHNISDHLLVIDVKHANEDIRDYDDDENSDGDGDDEMERRSSRAGVRLRLAAAWMAPEATTAKRETFPVIDFLATSGNQNPSQLIAMELEVNLNSKVARKI